MDHYQEGFPYLLQLGLGLVLLMGCTIVMEYLNRIWEWKLSKELGILVKSALFDRFISQSSRQFERKTVMDYVSFLNNTVAVLDEDYFSAWIDFIKSLLKLLIFVCSMVYVLNWPLTLTIFFLSALISYFPQLTRGRLVRLRKEDLEEQTRYNRKLADLLGGYHYVAPYSIQMFRQEHGQVVENRESKHFIFDQFRVFSDMVYSFGTNVMYATVFLLAGFFLIRGQFSVGSVTAALLYVGSLVGSIGDVLSCINVLHSSKEIVG